MNSPREMKNILVTSESVKERDLSRLSKLANVYASWTMEEKRIEEVLPKIDVLVVFLWPRFLTPDNMARMKRLEFLQSVLVGVNHVPFDVIDSGVTVASNAGAYSHEVAEHAWGLLLAASKKIVEHHQRIREGAKDLREFSREGAGITVLRGKTLGIIGYGGIGRVVGRFARAFGMNVVAFSRSNKREKAVRVLRGKRGLNWMLTRCDALVLSLPLTRETYHMIGQRELSMMKEEAILVNIARGDLVDQEALYSRLRSHPRFRYATDVWWSRNGEETLKAGKRFALMSNFVGTPHMSGPSAVVSGRPGAAAIDNVIRYIGGKTPRHIVDRREYSGPTT